MPGQYAPQKPGPQPAIDGKVWQAVKRSTSMHALLAVTREWQEKGRNEEGQERRRIKPILEILVREKVSGHNRKEQWACTYDVV